MEAYCFGSLISSPDSLCINQNFLNYALLILYILIVHSVKLIKEVTIVTVYNLNHSLVSKTLCRSFVTVILLNESRPHC